MLHRRKSSTLQQSSSLTAPELLSVLIRPSVVKPVWHQCTVPSFPADMFTSHAQRQALRFIPPSRFRSDQIYSSVRTSHSDRFSGPLCTSSTETSSHDAPFFLIYASHLMRNESCQWTKSIAVLMHISASWLQHTFSHTYTHTFSHSAMCKCSHLHIQTRIVL